MQSSLLQVELVFHLLYSLLAPLFLSLHDLFCLFYSILHLFYLVLLLIDNFCHSHDFFLMALDLMLKFLNFSHQLLLSFICVVLLFVPFLLKILDCFFMFFDFLFHLLVKVLVKWLNQALLISLELLNNLLPSFNFPLNSVVFFSIQIILQLLHFFIVFLSQLFKLSFIVISDLSDISVTVVLQILNPLLVHFLLVILLLYELLSLFVKLFL